MKFNYTLYRPKRRMQDAAVKPSAYFRAPDVTITPLSKIGDLSDVPPAAALPKPSTPRKIRQPIFDRDFDRSRLAFAPRGGWRQLRRTIAASTRPGPAHRFSSLKIGVVTAVIVCAGSAGLLIHAAGPVSLSNAAERTTSIPKTPPVSSRAHTSQKKSKLSAPVTPAPTPTPTPSPAAQSDSNPSADRSLAGQANTYPSADNLQDSGTPVGGSSQATPTATPAPSETPPTPTTTPVPTPVTSPTPTPSPTTSPTPPPTISSTPTPTPSQSASDSGSAFTLKQSTNY